MHSCSLDSESFQVAQAQQQSGKDVVLAAPVVEVEAAHVESANLQGPMQGEVILIVTCSTFLHVLRVLQLAKIPSS